MGISRTNAVAEGDLFSDPDVLRGCFGLYRARDAAIDQNMKRAAQPLPMPALTLEGLA